jgi:DNA-binding response OmpR family regulator
MSGKILVADDSPNIREILQMSLENLGYAVILAEDGERAMERFSQDKPDLLIVDVMMPKVNGFQICRRVKSNPATHAIPVILLTARSQQEDVYWGKDCGADEYMTKPFSTKELEQVVARLLRRRQESQTGRTSGVREEQRRRREDGRASQIVTLEWDQRALEVFRKKYGEMKYSESQRALRQAAEAFLEEIKDPGPVDLHEATGLTVVLGGAPEEAIRHGRELARRLSVMAASFYSPDDRGRGHIPFRDPRTGKEERLPLLAFIPRVTTEAA